MEGFINYLQREKMQSLGQAQTLANDNRQDEAIMAKIRANVFGIFETTAKGGHNVQKLLEVIPKPWEESLEQAKATNDHIKITQEQIKLQAIAEIKAFLAKE